MLKIKDNYDLNNLKKYGFEHIVGEYKPLCDFDCQIRISLDYWELQLEYCEYYISTKHKFIDITTESEYSVELNILWDMIQDGIVERID